VNEKLAQKESHENLMKRLRKESQDINDKKAEKEKFVKSNYDDVNY